MASEKIRRPQTRGEEIANTISHGLGAVLALAGAAPLAVRGILSGSAKTGFSLTAYAVSLVLLYTASAVYHGARDPEVKRRLRIMDHCSIFVLILGTYVPMSLLVVGGRLGWMLFLTNTTLAAIGITLNAMVSAHVASVPPAGLALLVGGGLAYTVGIVFYKARGKYMHFVWHLFVLAGSVLQFFCIALYCLP